MKRRLAVRGIIVNQGKLLCVKLNAYNHKPQADYWCIPGGGVDNGEPIIPALERELFEETNIHPDVGPLVFIQQFNHNNIEQLELFFYIMNAKDFLNIDLSASTHGITEINKIKFIDVAKFRVLPEFLKNENLDNLINQPVKIFNYL